ncbi:FecR family protein [uncultured Bacteroides sp.]|uniref:FecR family protein n=1 Tax=uncultured Bacteroides sp. TaxID=162156 RepID=UPI0025CF8213|nr:FecR family protein [uncultured Bacteroides sp.]
MEKRRIIAIIRKYLANRFPPETEERVQRWIIKDKDSKEKEKASQEYWNELDFTEADADTYSALERVNLRIGYNKEHLANIASYHKFSRFTHKYSRVAAIMLPLLIVAGGLFYFNPFSSGNEMIEISTAYGEQKHLFLPDSSEIWLNAGSSISYAKAFSKDERLVTLNGEAYFSVKRNTEKPFIVTTQQLSVKVLGTRFNVKAYPGDELITTTLTSGKVEINATSQQPQILSPNEQLTYDKNTSNIRISEVNAADAESWITGKLIFSNATSEEIFRTLERRYDIVVDNQTDTSASKRYTVKFLKGESVDKILDILSDIIGFSYQQDGNKVIITK